MIPIIGNTKDELHELLKPAGLTSSQIDRILYWLYRRRMENFFEMVDLPKSLRQMLADDYIPGFRPYASFTQSADGSKKYLFNVGEKGTVETVFLPEEKRNTLCMSVQAGCRMGCVFCQTGKGGFHGNLTAGEIINQFCSILESNCITHVVFMGMGEPFDNYHELIKTISILTSPWGLALGASQITVSTVGILPFVQEYLAQTKSHLAISVHSPFPEERKKWMPIENKYPVEELIDFLSHIPIDRRRRISIEYAMIKGVNDSMEHRIGLVGILKGKGFRVNLIPFNPVSGLDWEPSETRVIKEFRDFLDKSGIPSTIRKSRGTDVGAACGLLGGKRNYSYSEK